MVIIHLKRPNPCVSVLKKGGSLTDLETDSSSVSLPHTSLPKHLNLDLKRKPRRIWVGFHAHSLWHLCWDCQQGGQLVSAWKDHFFSPCRNDTCPLKLDGDLPVPWVPETAQPLHRLPLLVIPLAPGMQQLQVGVQVGPNAFSFPNK